MTIHLAITSGDMSLALGREDDDDDSNNDPYDSQTARRVFGIAPRAGPDEFVFTQRQASQLVDLLYFANLLLQQPTTTASLRVHGVTQPELPPGQTDWMRFRYLSELGTRLVPNTMRPTLVVPRHGLDEDELDEPSLTIQLEVLEAADRRIPAQLWPLRVMRSSDARETSWWWYDRSQHTVLSPFNPAYDQQRRSVTFNDYPNLLQIGDRFELTTRFGYDYVRRTPVTDKKSAFVFYTDADAFRVDTEPVSNFYGDAQAPEPTPIGAVFLYVPQPRMERSERAGLVQVIRDTVRTNEALCRVWRTIVNDRQSAMFGAPPALASLNE